MRKKIFRQGRRYLGSSNYKDDFHISDIKRVFDGNNAASDREKVAMPDYSGDDGGLGNFGYMLDDADLEAESGDIKKKTVIHGFDRHSFEVENLFYFSDFFYRLYIVYIYNLLPINSRKNDIYIFKLKS